MFYITKIYYFNLYKKQEQQYDSGRAAPTIKTFK